MANVDKPNGFRPVRTLSGAPVASVLRTITPAAADCFIGDMIELVAGTGTATPADGTALALALGVVVGVGTVDGEGNPQFYDPANLNKNFFDTSADVEADYVLIYAPANDCVFEAQLSHAPSADTTQIGDTLDILAGTGDSTTGRSAHELEAVTSGDVQIVDRPKYPGNDPDAQFGVLHVIVPQANQALI
ncbi:MAG: hypothetical protein ACYTFX_06295 [Planctomycetota bacterium]|jgi:hypothetical protein